MHAKPKSLPTRVFRAGNSQAVRIPKAFELPEGEVRIERRAGGLYIAETRGDWESFFDEPGVDFPFTATQLRDDRGERKVDTSWVDASSGESSHARSTKAPRAPARGKAGKKASKPRR